MNKRVIIFLVAIFIIGSLCGCGEPSPNLSENLNEPQANVMEGYSSLDEYFAAVQSGQTTPEPLAIPENLPEGAKFREITKRDTYVHTIYSYPYREDVFGPAEKLDPYDVEEATYILYERWLPGTTEDQKKANDEVIEKGDAKTITVDGTEYKYYLQGSKYYFSYIDSDAGAIFAAIPAFAPPEELIEFLDVMLVI
ncbi:MAG: hypothetical protein II350_02660 [Clostridia bacterium]|nr:hypothetical protein [Clostridia bacterium]